MVEWDIRDNGRAGSGCDAGRESGLRKQEQTRANLAPKIKNSLVMRLSR
jgi:hypothetical protein